ncbi:hypothetical protein Tco_0781107 [Tanacetum coccineum]
MIEANGNSHIIPGVYYAPEVTLNILSQEQLEKQGFQVTYDGNRCSLSLMFKDKEIKRFDEDRLWRMHNHYMQEYFESISKEGERLEQDTINIKGNLYTTKIMENLGGYLSVHFSQEFDMVGEIMGLSKGRFNMVVKWFFNHYLNRSLPGNIPPIINEFDMVGEIKWLNPKGNGEEIRRCYMNFLEILTSHYKTAKAPRQGNMDTMLGPARRDRECHHQGEIGRDGAQWRRPAVLKEKGNIEHVGVQLEDTNEGPEEPIQGHYKGNQNLYAESSSRVKEEYGPSTDNSMLTSSKESKAKAQGEQSSEAPLTIEPIHPYSPIPPRDESKCKGITTEDNPMKELLPLMDKGGSAPTMQNLGQFSTFGIQMAMEDARAQLEEMKRMNALTANKEESEKVLKKWLRAADKGGSGDLLALCKLERHWAKLLEIAASRLQLLFQNTHK